MAFTDFMSTQHFGSYTQAVRDIHVHADLARTWCLGDSHPVTIVEPWTLDKGSRLSL